MNVKSLDKYGEIKRNLFRWGREFKLLKYIRGTKYYAEGRTAIVRVQSNKSTEITRWEVPTTTWIWHFLFNL
jgi:hypothetical protein